MTRLIVLTIAILVVVGAVLATSGVLRVQNSKDESGITIDKKELKEKTQEAVKTTEAAGGKILDKTGEALHKAAEKVRAPSPDQKTPATTPQLNDRNPRLPEESKQPPEKQGAESSAGMRSTCHG